MGDPIGDQLDRPEAAVCRHCGGPIVRMEDYPDRWYHANSSPVAGPWEMTCPDGQGPAAPKEQPDA